MCESLNQFLAIVLILSKFSTCKQHLRKVVNILARLNIIFVSICDPGMPRIYLAINPPFGNYLSWFHHQGKGSSHLVGGMDNLLNKYTFLVTSVRKDSSKDAPTPKMLPSYLGSSRWPKEVHASIVGFKVSNQVMKKGLQFSNHIQKQVKLHPYFPPNFPQFIVIWIKDPTQ
jgi:hypothetical protein